MPKVLHPAEVKHLEGAAEAYAADAKKHVAEARKLTAEAKAAEIVLATKTRDERKELAKNEHHKVYVFDQPVTDTSVKSCVNQLVTWSRQDPKCEIEIQINSPGGSIIAGFALIDSLGLLRDKDHKITMIALGMAASMAGVVLQSADVRVMGANALMLIHEGSLGAVGDFGEVEDRVKLMQMMHERILTLFEERATPINPKTTKRYIRNHWERRDWWLTAGDCLRLGFVDEIR